jgi:hypothetical protein
MNCFFLFFPCKPLKSHKTAKAILGKIWRILTIIWKYLANPCAPLAGWEGATLLESLVASAALAKANAKIPKPLTAPLPAAEAGRGGAD